MNTVYTRALWLACALLSSLIVGAVGGFLALVAGAHPAVAVIASGAGFAATTRLIMKIVTFVAAPTRNDPGPHSDDPTP